MLRERPVVSLWILGVVPAVAITGLVGLGEDRGARGLRAPEMRVQVVHVDVHLRSWPAASLRALVARTRVTHHDHPVREPHLGVVHGALRIGGPQPLAEAESAGEELERTGHVLIQEIRGDPGHAVGRVHWHSPEAR
jgi:hypothetical protein